MKKTKALRSGGSEHKAKGQVSSDTPTNSPATTNTQPIYSGQERLGAIQQCRDGTWLAVAADETLVGYYPTAQKAARAFPIRAQARKGTRK